MYKDWKWFGNAGHFIGSNHCRFHLATQVKNYLVSTVGEYIPYCNKNEEKFQALSIEPQSYYETMIFEIEGYCSCGCGLPEPNVGKNPDGLECHHYSTARHANEGHLKLCEKYDKMED